MFVPVYRHYSHWLDVKCTSYCSATVVCDMPSMQGSSTCSYNTWLTSFNSLVSEDQNKMEHEVCQYYQTGFCKFGQNCRKMHQSIICQQKHDFKSLGCTLRHPKTCRSYEREGTCKFKEDCAYKHQKSQRPETVSSNQQEILNLQQEMSQMKSLIKLMSDTILFLAETIENITKTNIHKIVAIVASSLGSKKES